MAHILSPLPLQIKIDGNGYSLHGGKLDHLLENSVIVLLYTQNANSGSTEKDYSLYGETSLYDLAKINGHSFLMWTMLSANSCPYVDLLHPFICPIYRDTLAWHKTVSK